MTTTQRTVIKNIVCIDDNEVDYFIFQKQLRLSGFIGTIWYYNNPLVALNELREKLNHIEPDIFVVDYNMPDMNGMDCIENIQNLIKEACPNKNLPIILYSSGNFNIYETLLKKSGVGFIEKPIGKSEVELLLKQKILVN